MYLLAGPDGTHSLEQWFSQYTAPKVLVGTTDVHCHSWKGGTIFPSAKGIPHVRATPETYLLCI